MGVCVLVLGYSASGKSYSLRNFEPDEVGIFNVVGKPMPFRKKLPMLNRSTYRQIHEGLAANKRHAYVIDDANYLMAFQNFSLVRQKGYDKFTQMAYDFEQMLEATLATDDDTIVYIMMHVEDENGRIKPKTIGKMLDNQLCIEGLVSIVLMADKDDDGYFFLTNSMDDNPVKSPPGMFDQRIDNDLKMVDTTIRDYYDMAPLTAQKEGK